MLGFIGKWAGSKGMGRVPNLEGLSLNEARTAIANAGFNLGNETSRGNSEGANSSNNGKAKGRVDTDSLLDYESTVDFEYYSYVVVPNPTPTPTPTPTPDPGPTPTPNPTPNPGPTPTPVTCGACESYTIQQLTCNGEDSYWGNYTGTRKACSDGTYEVCTQPTFSGYGALYQANSVSCGGSGSNPNPTPNPTPDPGPTPGPTPNPTPTIVNTVYGPCSAYAQCPEGGERLVTIEYSDGSTYESYQCCSYSAPTPSPTPNPSPTPSPTPDPGPTPTPTPNPSPNPGPTPTPTCTPNCVYSSYTCSGWASITYYTDANGCGPCDSVYDQYGCA